MLTDSIYKNLGRPDKNGRLPSLGLNVSAIEIIAGYKPDEFKKIYERYSIRYLTREILAWEKLGKYGVAKIIKSIIEERKGRLESRKK